MFIRLLMPAGSIPWLWFRSPRLAERTVSPDCVSRTLPAGSPFRPPLVRSDLGNSLPEASNGLAGSGISSARLPERYRYERQLAFFGFLKLPGFALRLTGD